MSEKQTRSELEPMMLRKLERLVSYARLIVYWERLWPRFWPFLILCSLFGGLVLFDILPKLPASLHLLVLGVFLLGLGASLTTAFRGLSWPSRQDAIVRLEKDSELRNQPLSVLLDKPADLGKNRFALAIWITHQDRMAEAMKLVRLKWPKSYLYKRDPYSIRAALILLLVLGGVEARYDWTDRFVRAFMPSDGHSKSQSWKLQAWINPPQHTGWGPIYLSAQAETAEELAPIEVPQHSQVMIRLEGRPSRDKVVLSTGVFEDEFTNFGKGVFNLETQVEQGEFLEIRKSDETLYKWPILIKADMPPAIKLSGQPQSGFRGHLNIRYKAGDDYGLSEAVAQIRLADQRDGDVINLQDAVQGYSAKGTFRANLAAHPWAGRDVIVTPQVTDNAGQKSFGRTVKMVLPQRKFTHPLAMRLITVRKSLYEGVAESNLYARLILKRILENPIDFDHQIPVYISLRVGADRLRGEMSEEALESVRSILWETAVHLDEGAAGNVRNQLEDLSRQMQDMLRNAEDRAAMEALFEQMRQSLDQYLQQMSKSMEHMDSFEEALSNEDVEMVGRDELMDLLEKARELMRTGDMKAAQAMMEQFQQILSRLAMQQAPDAQQAKAAKEIMDALRRIEEAERKLLDQTFKRSRNQDRPSLSSTKQAILEAEEQKRILDELRDQFKRLSELNTKTPDALREAEKAMKRAAQSLERGLDEDAIQAETRAVDHLREGLQNSAQALAQRMGMQPMSRQLPGYDPLGRGRPGRMELEEGQMVPSEAEMHRSREILKELYRRAGQKGRTDQELQYIERLLERF